MDKDAYIERMTAQQKLEQQKKESTQMKRLAVEIREQWLAQAREEGYAEKHLRQAVIDERTRQLVEKKQQERRARTKKAARLLHDSKLRIAAQEEDERQRFVVRMQRSHERMSQAELQRLATIDQRAKEAGKRKLLHRAVRERSAELYEERQAGFAAKNVAKEESAQRHMRLERARHRVRFDAVRKHEAKQRRLAAQKKHAMDEELRQAASLAYEAGDAKTRARADRLDLLAQERQRFKWTNRVQQKTLRDQVDRYRQTGTISPQLAHGLRATLGVGGTADSIRASMLKPGTRDLLLQMQREFTDDIDDANERARRQDATVSKALDRFRKNAKEAQLGGISKHEQQSVTHDTRSVTNKSTGAASSAVSRISTRPHSATIKPSRLTQVVSDNSRTTRVRPSSASASITRNNYSAYALRPSSSLLASA